MSNFCNFKILRQEYTIPIFLDLSFENSNYEMNDGGESNQQYISWLKHHYHFVV